MNVTNRRKSTDADTPTTQPTQQHQQHQQQLLAAYVSCRQAATATTNRTRQEQLQNFQHRVNEVLEDNNDDQEQVVTSTSSDCLLPLAAEGEGEEVTLELDALVTSPARITSSTNSYEILTYNSDSLSLEEMVMPSTSDNARLEREGAAAATSLNNLTHHHSINTRISKSSNDMVARDTTPTTVAPAGDGGGGGLAAGVDRAASTSSSSSNMVNENHKIILKLPKPTTATTTESHLSNSHIEDDLRKVEPLKINLHNTTHHTSHHAPKITIKPIVKKPPADILMSSEDCSSSAEDEMVSKLNASEPHIVPKLTIRSKNEEHSTVVPKLTIKINDSTNVSTEAHNTQPAANTPPLPKLTIKTGQDGHSESIITNISPASSTTSSSSSSLASFSSSSTSTNSQLATNSSAANTIPKLTIKPLQKSHETTDSEHPSIPKLCIKGNMICGESAATEDVTNSKIPKLTIKTGQEHAVIITQHNDNANALGCIPKLTIKTKSLDSAEDSANINANISSAENEKIPKITIKTNNMDSANIVGSSKRSLIKSQLESSPLSPKHAVPKLTITRQQNDMVVTNKHLINTEEECNTGSIPKMTIKTQNKTEIVPKLTIKNISCSSSSSQQRPSSTEESGMESDNEDEEEPQKGGGKNSVLVQHCKTVPKLTIKNLGSPQQKLKVVQEASAEVNKTNKITNTLAVGELFNVNLVSSPADTDEFADLLTVDNGGGESSNSQEFCGFNDNTADSSSKVVVLPENDIVVQQNDTEVRRNSDDMDIDEDLQTVHEPQIFQNDLHFKNQTTEMPDILNGKIHHQKITQIIDTVDLTSSPSRSSSPAQFDYNEDSNPVVQNATNLTIPSTNILLERLQRETSVIQNTQQLKQHQQQELQQTMENNAPVPPPLQPKPNAMQTSAPASLKYPQLAERLMANGTSPIDGTNNNNNTTHQTLSPQVLNSKEENIIDSIEILDTPEGSPRNSLDECPENLQHLSDKITTNLPNGVHYPKDSEIYVLNNNNSNLKRHALQSTNLAGQINLANHIEENNIVELAVPPSKQRRLNNEAMNTKNSQLTVNNNNDLTSQKVLTNSLEELTKSTITTAVAVAAVASQTNDFNSMKQMTTPQTSHQRARKQKHENLLPIAMEEVVETMQTISNDSFVLTAESHSNEQTTENATPVQKKRGRPRKSVAVTNTPNDVANSAPPAQLTIPAQKEETPQTDLSSKSRRVQLLRKRLAIDMVDADEPLRVLDEMESSVNIIGGAAGEENINDIQDMESQRRERNLRTPLRTSRRSNTPTVGQMESKTKGRTPSTLATENNSKKSLLKQNNENTLNHFLESNSNSISSSACANSSATLTSTVTSINHTTLSMASQIDLTMSSSSSNSNGSTTNTITTVEATFSKQTAGAVISNIMTGQVMGSGSIACIGTGTVSGGGGGGGSSNNSMLPPTTILSSDPLPDVIFKPNDFSSILVTQQLRAPMMYATDSVQSESQDEDMADDISGPENSGDDSASSSSMSTTPGRGRGRGRGSRGGRGRGYKAHRLGRNASAVSKAIAMSRPRAVGALKHTPDPDRIKGLLYSPSPSVFEEDTRMSADLTQNTTQPEPPQTPTKQPDFLNNEESQSSVISNTSMLDPNNVASLQNGSAVKKPVKRKKMEVCVAEDAELTVSSIAEYDWPPPKGCCPSKNRDTFMIQEQVALYLGIKSFKRKYPDLPRRQIDMEERNYLQEKNLVSEKMCDLGITAVWASDILDIMYSDFYDKYEEYKDFVRQKHLREIEAKQKSLGLNVAGRGLQARERAMLSTSKWNAYLNRTRKEERLSCLDLQTLIVNKPCPASAPIAAVPNRPVADAVARAAKAEKIPQPPTLLKKRVWEPIRPRDVYYPLSLVPGQFCEKYYDYSARELRQFPLNTMLDAASHILQSEETTDTDSAAETIDLADCDKASSISASERLSKQRRIRRIRAKHSRKLSNDEFKVPPLPGTTLNSSTDSVSSSSDETSSDSDSDTSSCSSSYSDDSSEDENLPATCGVCQHPENRNLKDMPEIFVQCYTCRRKVHPSCIEMPHRMANRVRNYNWQCADCKCCIKCKRKQDRNKMLYCEQCDRGFHIYCLSIKAVPDGRWSCERCSICMRCGATKPEGLPVIQPNGEKLKVKHRKLKWINEYRIDHVTKFREHCSMLCVPCGRAKNIKRVQINTHNNTTNTYNTSPGSSCSALSPSSQNMQHSPTPASNTTTPQISPINTSGSNGTTASANIGNLLNAAATQSLNTINATSTILSTTNTTSSSTTTEKSLESKDSISITTNSLTLTNTTTPQNTTPNTATDQTSTTTTAYTLSSYSFGNAASPTNSAIITTAATTTTESGGAPPVVA